MKKRIFKLVLTCLFVCIFIVSFSLTSFAYSLPPSESVLYYMPDYDNTPYNDSVNSSYHLITQFWILSNSGYPYYVEFYLDNLAFEVYSYFYLYSGSSYSLSFELHNLYSSSQSVSILYYVYDGLTGSILDSYNYFYSWQNNGANRFTSLIVPAQGVSVIHLATSFSNGNYIHPYINSRYCNWRLWSGELEFIADSYYHTYLPISFPYLINGFTPGSYLSYSQGSLTPEYDSQGNLINYNFELTQDNSDIINSINQSPEGSPPSISDSSASEFESAVSDLPTIQDRDLNIVFDSYGYDSNNSAIRWIYSTIDTIFSGNQKVFSVALSFMVLSLLMLLLNKRGQ